MTVEGNAESEIRDRAWTMLKVDASECSAHLHGRVDETFIGALSLAFAIVFQTSPNRRAIILFAIMRSRRAVAARSCSCRSRIQSGFFMRIQLSLFLRVNRSYEILRAGRLAVLCIRCTEGFFARTRIREIPTEGKRDREISGNDRYRHLARARFK